MRAFDAHVADFLLKPVEFSRLLEAWRRAHDRLGVAGGPGPKFFLPVGDGVRIYSTDSLLAVNAEGNYTRVCLVGGQNVLVRMPYAAWIAAIPAGVLIEAKRGRAVNRRHIVSVSGGRDDREIRLNDGTTVRVSRSHTGKFDGEIG